MGDLHMIKRGFFVLAISLMASPFLFAQADTTLCGDLVSRVPTRYSEVIYNMTSRIDQLAEIVRNDEQEALYQRLLAMRSAAARMDAEQVSSELARCQASSLQSK